MGMGKVLITVTPAGAIGFQAEGLDHMRLIAVLEIVKSQVVKKATEQPATLVRMPDGSTPPPSGN